MIIDVEYNVKCSGWKNEIRFSKVLQRNSARLGINVLTVSAEALNRARDGRSGPKRTGFSFQEATRSSNISTACDWNGLRLFTTTTIFLSFCGLNEADIEDWTREEIGNFSPLLVLGSPAAADVALLGLDSENIISTNYYYAFIKRNYIITKHQPMTLSVMREAFCSRFLSQERRIERLPFQHSTV